MRLQVSNIKPAVTRDLDEFLNRQCAIDIHCILNIIMSCGALRGNVSVQYLLKATIRFLMIIYFGLLVNIKCQIT
jgi:hypothetical protein